ncbi:MAG: hypothetical protein C4308_03000 [Chitinophagaceae bacterium]
MAENEFEEIAARAIRLESRTNLLFSFEKMALRDAVKTSASTKRFAEGLFDYVYGKGSMQKRYENFTAALDSLSRKQTRVTTWPLQKVFGFIGDPQQHIFFKTGCNKNSRKKMGLRFSISLKTKLEQLSKPASFC